MTNMTTKCLVGSALLAGAAWAADTVPPLDIRPGNWEGSVTTQTSGAPSIPPELLARMTPEQQAALQARMKERDSRPPRTIVRTQCVTKEDLRKLMTFGDDRGSCQKTIVSASSSKQEFHIDCNNSGIKAAGTVRIEAIDPEHVKFSSQIASGDGAHAMKISTTGTGKWIGAECSSDAKK
jgi:hypothetical protein